jgi:hypothetical protein
MIDDVDMGKVRFQGFLDYFGIFLGSFSEFRFFGMGCMVGTKRVSYGAVCMRHVGELEIMFCRKVGYLDFWIVCCIICNHFKFSFVFVVSADGFALTAGCGS